MKAGGIFFIRGMEIGKCGKAFDSPIIGFLNFPAVLTAVL